VYNKQFRDRGSNMSGVKDALEFLKGVCIMDDMMHWRYTVNENGMIRRLFWCDVVNRMDYTMFCYVFDFDATNWEIRYNTSLVIFSRVNHHNESVIFGSAIVDNETEESYV
jgi:hypothetical protein